MSRNDIVSANSGDQDDLRREDHEERQRLAGQLPELQVHQRDHEEDVQREPAHEVHRPLDRS